MRLCLLIFCFLHIGYANAADINLRISQSSQDDQVHIIVENRSRQAVLIKQLELVLNKRTYLIDWTGSISSGHKHFEFKVELPTMTGSYAQQINLYYVHDSKIFT
jgi:hypothetical protein